MSEFPNQTRTIDPYSSYNSNVVNQLTRMITRGKNCLHGTHAIDVVIDSTASDTEIIILPGEGFKDDVIIQIDEIKTVDMSDSDYYINHLNPFNEAGYYYICLEYIYAKARPAPEAKIRLLKPSQIHLYDEDNSAFLLLKIANVIFNGSTFEVSELFDFDPNNPNVCRIFTQIYAGAEDTLVPFETNRDEGRLIYVKDRDEMFFGINDRWESFNAIRANIDTSACQSGELAYIDRFGEAQPAIALTKETLAECVVLVSGVDIGGKVRLSGEVTGVKIESGITISYGDHLYLSQNEAGTLSNEKPHSYLQYIGISVTQGSVNNECDIWFLPQRTNIENKSGNEIDFYQDLLHSSVFEYLFIESFDNDDFIDTTGSNIEITKYDNTLQGITGDYYQTIPIQVSSFNTQMIMTQITSKFECLNASTIDWYVSNNGSEDLDWELVELDTLHYFSSYRLSFSSGSGTFQIGENVHSGTTNKMATINGMNGGEILVFGDTRYGLDYLSGETITGMISGATGVINVVTNRQQPTYHDLRLKIEFNGNIDDIKINDFGVLYDQDEDIFEELDIDVQKNIDTLYLDTYTWPSQDNDGLANLTTPLETQIHDLINYVDGTIYADLHDLEDFVDNTCCVRLDQVENDTVYNTDRISDLEDFVDNTCCVRLDQVETDTVYNTDRISDLEDFVDNTCCVSIAQLETDISSLEGTSIYLQDQIDDIQDTTGAFHITQMNSLDIDTLYSDVYTSPHRDENGFSNIAIPLETQINNIQLASLNPNPPLIINTAITNPDVSDMPSIIRFDYAVNLTVIDFINGDIGQELILVFTNNNIIIQHNFNISLANGGDFQSQNEFTLSLVHNGTRWIERSGIVSTMILDGGNA